MADTHAMIEEEKCEDPSLIENFRQTETKGLEAFTHQKERKSRQFFDQLKQRRSAKKEKTLENIRVTEVD